VARTDHRKAATARAAAQAGDTETLRAALTEERRGYVVRSLPERIKQVDAVLRTLPSAPAQPKAAKPAAAKAEGAPRGSAKSQVPAPGPDGAGAPDATGAPDDSATGGDKPGQA